MTILQAALEWAKDGIPVFPCNANKTPATEKGFYDASTDPDKIRAMFEKTGAGTLIGARMGAASGLFAIDVDLYKPGEEGASAQQYLAKLLADGLAPATQRHRTMSGGVHLIYESDSVWPNCKPAAGVEIKGEGGYIILPPSRGYTVEEDAGFTLAPPKLIEVLMESRRQHAAQNVEQLKNQIRAAKGFHDNLASLAAKYNRRGWQYGAIKDELLKTLHESVASDPNHERHARWYSIVSDATGELSRILNSGREKFNTNAKDESTQDAVDEEVAEALKKIAQGIFAGSPNEGNEPALPKPEDYGDEWPFAGQGYYASDEIDVSSQRFNVFPVFAENESVLIAADPKAGKTAISLRLAYALATGKSWGDFQITEARGVLHYALEGTRAVALRLEAEKRRQKDEGNEVPSHIPLFVIERTPNFLHNKHEQAAKVIAADQYMLRTTGKGLGLVTIDTLTKAMPGADQNSVDDTAALFEFVDLIRAGGVTATVLFVHHTGKDGKTRGSSNLEAEVDVVLKAKKQEDGTSVMYVHMARSIDGAYVWNFALKGYDLGTSDQGIPLSAPYVELLSTVSGADEATENAQRAKAVVPILEAIFKLGLGTHSFNAVMKILKDERVIGGRDRRSKVLDTLALVFEDKNYTMYRKHVFTLNKDGNLDVTGITVSEVSPN